MTWITYILLTLVLPTGEETWPAFLGAGSELEAGDTLPLQWSPTEQVSWRTTLTGHGQSSPVVWGNRVFVTSVEGPNKETFHTICFDLQNGKELWRGSLANSTPVTNSYYVSRAAPTPVVDGNGVIALFESGDCVAYSHQGTERWTRKLGIDEGPLVAEFGLGASPCQDASNVYVLLDHDGPGCLLGLDKETGKTQWKAPRTARRSWSSPIMMNVDGIPQVVVSSAGSVDGYEPKSGKLLWSFTDVGGNTGTTPMDMGNGKILIGASPGRNGENAGSATDSNCLLEITHTGDQWSANRRWVAKGATPSWASPIIHQDLAYWVNRAGVVLCFDAMTGEKVYSKRIKQSCWATPFAMGDRIYFFGQRGLVTVLAAGREFKVLAENESWNENTLPAESPLPEEASEDRRRGAAMFSKPTLYGVAVVDNSFILRVGNSLIRIGKSEQD